MGTKAERDAQLDQLKLTFEEWVDRRIERHQKEAEFLRRILEERGATDRVQNDVINELTAIAETDLNRFLTG
jgi:hypothetical protein